jgi:hypothetical protein
MLNLMRRGELLEPSRSNEEEVAAIERERPLREKLLLKMPQESNPTTKNAESTKVV